MGLLQGSCKDRLVLELWSSLPGAQGRPSASPLFLGAGAAQPPGPLGTGIETAARVMPRARPRHGRSWFLPGVNKLKVENECAPFGKDNVQLSWRWDSIND